MNNTVKFGLIGLGGIALGYALANCFRKDEKGKTKKKKKSSKVSEPELKQNTQAKSKEVFPLKLGSEGREVKRLQVYLMRKLGFVRKPNGVFDNITLKRVQKWFKRNDVSEAIYQKLQLNRMVHDQRKMRRNGRKKG